jgi:hypothetical protein
MNPKDKMILFITDALAGIIDDDAGQDLLEILSRKPSRADIEQRTCAVCNTFVFRGTVPIEYMVEDHIWKAAGFQKNEVACVGCLETRLGRPLVFQDFTNALINSVVRWFLDPKRTT